MITMFCNHHAVRSFLRKRIHGALTLTLAIFGGAAVVAAPPTEKSYVASLRRLTEQEYRNSIADIFGKEIEVRGTFEPTKRTGGLEAASTALLSVTPVGFESFSKMANDIAAQVTAEKYRAKLGCAPKDSKAADDVCAREILSRYGLLLFRRPLTAAELENRIGLSRTHHRTNERFLCGRAVCAGHASAVAGLPFRTEVAIPSADGKGGTLDSYSRATRLSFLMWNTAPDAELLRRQGMVNSTRRGADQAGGSFDVLASA